MKHILYRQIQLVRTLVRCARETQLARLVLSPSLLDLLGPFNISSLGTEGQGLFLNESIPVYFSVSLKLFDEP
jgi:hypothetical protein